MQVQFRFHPISTGHSSAVLNQSHDRGGVLDDFNLLGYPEKNHAGERVGNSLPVLENFQP